MRMHCNGLLIGLLLATASPAAFAADPAPAPAPPPPTMDDPGQPATAESIKPDDPRLAPLPAESAPAAPVAKSRQKKSSRSDGDPTYSPKLPTDDAFHPPLKQAGETISADGYSVRTYTTNNGDRIEEYRQGGQLSKVRVQPANGFPYELRKSDANGQADRANSRDNKVEPVHFTLFEWH